MEKESQLINVKYPGYKILTTSEERQKNYSMEEIETIISMKKGGHTLKEILESLNRTYWSVVYKISELKKKNFCSEVNLLKILAQNKKVPRNFPGTFFLKLTK
ncbi:hypothetical protein DOE78_22890 [Bacillus sp. Y1]|nr:hypothetical protein [Bacillus sp. Y1]AYA78015.1 hypothetical protein DOE78_22890 [Bacillus sp. Y1]